MRASGLLLGIAGLPGNYGIGKLGKEARNFVDFLKKSGQRYWQILPLSPTGYGDSPYQSCSVRAGNPYFIDFETLEQEGLLKPADYQNTQFGDNPRYPLSKRRMSASSRTRGMRNFSKRTRTGFRTTRSIPPSRRKIRESPGTSGRILSRWLVRRLLRPQRSVLPTK